MSFIKDNGDGTVTMPKDLLQSLVKESIQTKEDVELSVDVIAKVLKVLGIIEPTGEFKNDFRVRHLVKAISGLVTESMFSSDSVAKRFDFLMNDKCYNTIMRYSYLYKPNQPQRVKSPVDLEFEEILNK